MPRPVRRLRRLPLLCALALLPGLAGPASAPAASAWFDDVRAHAPASEVVSAETQTRSTTSRPALELPGVPYSGVLATYAKAYRLEPAFVAAIARAESGFNPVARSRAGARGLMQVMPATARGLGVAARQLYDPVTNIATGTLYLATVRASVGPSVRLMAAAYNAGPGAVRRFGGIPPYAETRAYVRKVVRYRAAYLRGTS